MNVKFKGNPEIFKIGVIIVEKNLVKLHPPIPEDVDLTAGFELLTNDKGGKVFGDYTQYTTIYRQMDDGSVILSNDGSVWEPPVYTVNFSGNNCQIIGESKQTPKIFEDLILPELIPNENYEFLGWGPEIPATGDVDRNITFYAQMKYVPTIEEVKSAKKTEISAACEQIIHDGIDVVMPDGSVEHFSLLSNDQINLFGKQAQLAAGAAQLEYHQDGHPCRYYTAEEMQMIIKAAMEHVSYHTTYCNSLNMWIVGAKSVEEVNTIYYGADIPEEYQSEVLKDYLAQIVAEAEGAVNETVS